MTPESPLWQAAAAAATRRWMAARCSTERRFSPFRVVRPGAAWRQLEASREEAP